MATTGYTVTIIGGTGGLGQHISQAFLTDFRSSFAHVRVLTRNTASEKAQDLQQKGAELYTLPDGDASALSQALDKAFAGADVIVNVLSAAPLELKRTIIQALARSDAKVYFLSEYGSDHRVNDFPGYDHPEWTTKQELASETRAAAKGKKVIALYTSVFLELVFSLPILGFDIQNNTYTTYGSPAQKLTTTSQVDIGRAVARLSVLALDSKTAANVPDEIRIAGDTVSYEDVRDIVARVKGIEKGKIVSEDLHALKEAIRKDPGKNFLDYIRVVIGEGKADFSDNDNELVNPGETFWKWRKVEDFLRNQ